MNAEMAIAAVVADANKPSPDQGGPCATCALRAGTDANQAAVTMTTIELCLDAGETFHCHERTQLCRGWIAAANLLGADAVPPFQRTVAAAALEQLNDLIDLLRQGEPLPDARAMAIDLLKRVGA